MAQKRNWRREKGRARVVRGEKEERSRFAHLKAEVAASLAVGAGVKGVSVVTQKESIVGKVEKDVSDRYRGDDEGDGPTDGTGEGGIGAPSGTGEGVSEFVSHGAEVLAYALVAFGIWQALKFIRRSSAEGAPVPS